MITFSRVFGLFVLVLLLAGCGEQKARIDEPHDYRKSGVTFRYPGNWKVTEDDEADVVRTVSIETPGNGIVMLLVYNASDAPDLAAFAKLYSDAAKKEMPVGKVTATKFGEVRRAGACDVLTEKFTISLGVKVPHDRTYYRKLLGEKICLIVAQAPTEDSAKVEPGVALVVSSLEHETR